MLVLHTDGIITRIEYNDGWLTGGKLAKYDVKPGDEILVMPQIDDKTVQYTSDIMAVAYQWA